MMIDINIVVDINIDIDNETKCIAIARVWQSSLLLLRDMLRKDRIHFGLSSTRITNTALLSY